MRTRVVTFLKLCNKYDTTIMCAILASLAIIWVFIKSPMAGGFALFAALMAAAAGLFGHYRYSGTPPISVEDHVNHVIENTLNELVMARTHQMTPLNISRKVAEELMYENLISVDDYERTKLAILSQFSTSTCSGTFQGEQIVTSVAPFIRS